MTLFGKTIVGIILLLIALTGYYFYSDSQKIEIPPVADVATTTQVTGKKIAFSQLVSQNGTYKCTVSHYSGDVENKGIVYMDKGMLRAEFGTDVTNQHVDTIMIVRDGYTYSWNSLATTAGFKSKMLNNTIEATSTETATSSKIHSWNADQIGDYTCEAWTADEAMFALPATVKFSAVN